MNGCGIPQERKLGPVHEEPGHNGYRVDEEGIQGSGQEETEEGIQGSGQEETEVNGYRVAEKELQGPGQGDELAVAVSGIPVRYRVDPKTLMLKG